MTYCSILLQIQASVCCWLLVWNSVHILLLLWQVLYHHYSSRFKSSNHYLPQYHGNHDMSNVYVWRFLMRTALSGGQGPVWNLVWYCVFWFNGREERGLVLRWSVVVVMSGRGLKGLAFCCLPLTTPPDTMTSMIRHTIGKQRSLTLHIKRWPLIFLNYFTFIGANLAINNACSFKCVISEFSFNKLRLDRYLWDFVKDIRWYDRYQQRLFRVSRPYALLRATPTIPCTSPSKRTNLRYLLPRETKRARE